jgi:hypothetical protein
MFCLFLAEAWTAYQFTVLLVTAIFSVDELAVVIELWPFDFRANLY